MCYEAVLLYVELVITGREIVEREATLVIRRRCTYYRAVRVQQSDVCTAQCRAIAILNRSRNLSVGIERESSAACEKDPHKNRMYLFHSRGTAMYRRGVTTTRCRRSVQSSSALRVQTRVLSSSFSLSARFQHLQAKA